MNVSEHFQIQQRWRNLQVRKEAPILQFFADYSPESWWQTRYEPCVQEARHLSQFGFISRSAVQTQVTLGLMSCNPKFVLFHRRTITSRVYWQIGGNFPEVHPLFVVSHPREASQNPTMPLPEWMDLIQDGRDGRCTLVVEDIDAMAELAKLGVQRVRYLPPVISLPSKFRAEGNHPSDNFRVLLSADAYPSNDLLTALLDLASWQIPSQKPLHLQLALGDGYESTQQVHREGLIHAAKMLFKSVDVWDSLPRTKFLRRVALSTDAVFDPKGGSTVATEAERLGVPVYRRTPQGEIVSAWTSDCSAAQNNVSDARQKFWEGLISGE